MDLTQIVPVFNLYNPRWPLHTWMRPLPPAKFVFDEDGPGGVRRVGYATNSLVSEGSIVSGGHVSESVLGPRVRVNSYSHVHQSILHEGVDIGRHCRIRRTIIDKNVRIPANTEIGFDLEADLRRFQVIDGIVVIPKNYDFG
jgi:glucose-1-phosphate adenylyltransferase